MNTALSTASAAALRVHAASANLDSLQLLVEDCGIPQAGPGQVLVEIVAAGVNPSDVKAALGHMPQAIWPRTPGRDFAGIVRSGPAGLLGREVWGGGGELGITQDGSHGKWMVLPQSAVREKPEALSFEEAGSVGVPFITAFEGFREAGGVQPWDRVLVCGINGKVGQAAAQLATMAGAHVYGVHYKAAPYAGFASSEIEMFDSSSQSVAEQIREATGGHGADIVFNTMGSPYFAIANDTLARQGRQIFISTFDRAVDFDIFRFFRGRHRFIGIDSLALSSTEGARIFDRLKPAFDKGCLKPFPVKADSIHSLSNASEAYRAVLRSTPDRIVLRP